LPTSEPVTLLSLGQLLVVLVIQAVYVSALEALRNALYKFKTYLLTYLLNITTAS